MKQCGKYDRSYGIPVKIINSIKCLYENSEAKVFFNDTYSNSLKVNSGVLQGDTLAPFLFIIVMNYVLSSIPQDCGFITHQNPNIFINHLAFADDIVLLDINSEMVPKQFINLKNKASSIGLTINVKKTKYMTNIISDDYFFDDVERVIDFIYLGSKISSSTADFQVRKAKALNEFWKMNKIWKSHDIHYSLKLRIFESMCLPILMYGCETWIITKSLEKQIDSFATSCYRVILGIQKIEHINNIYILQTLNRKPLHILIFKRQLEFLGKTLRTTKNIIAKKYALYYPGHGILKIGKTRQPS